MGMNKCVCGMRIGRPVSNNHNLARSRGEINAPGVSKAKLPPFFSPWLCPLPQGLFYLHIQALYTPGHSATTCPHPHTYCMLTGKEKMPLGGWM